jgi:DNA-binding NarL/FixJ family response regulator
LEGSITRILVVDDYEPWRRFVSTTLQKQPTLQVIGEAVDGLEAVQKAQQLQPDLILLDIGLPTLNGIEAARRIRELSPKSRILFVSENRSWDIAEEALRTGAGGYVVKSDAVGELLPAVNAVLGGRRFVSASLSANDLTHPKDEHTADHNRGGVVLPFPAQNVRIARRHEAGFYSDDAGLLEGFTRFIGAALRAGNAVIVVATEPHRDRLLPRLQSHGLDIAAAIEQGRYIPLDAAATLSTFMVDDLPDSARFFEAAAHLFAAAVKAAKGERPHPRVAVCGECDPPLWTLGNGEAAIRLEKLWNEIAKTHDVDILCGYPLGSFHSVQGSQIFQRICAEHSAVYSQ